MKNLSKIAMTMLAAMLLALAGCAHNIRIVPDSSALAADASTAKIDRKVGYYISPENRIKVVETPAGGGDQVSYTPYADLEAGLNQVLSNVFAEVSVIKDIKDADFLRNNNISFVFVPTIDTTSSSRNNFFWPPTDFSVSLECLAVDSQGREVWKKSVKADGGLIAVKVILNERGLAGRRAAENALKLLQNELLKAPELRQ